MPRELRRYERKRNFEKTPEPAPAARKGPSSPGRRTSRQGEREPRFVIHQHSARRLHWDLRLEHDGALASWAVPKGMPEEPGENRFAAATEDHPLEYLDFHGEIPKGNYGAGTMTIWDRGTYEVLKWEPRKVEVLLHGERLQARYALFPIDKEEPPKDWMIHRMDPPADPDREPMPERIVPMLARTGQLPAEDSGWGFEIKWDGVRAIAYSTPGELRLESRNLNEITDSYPELARLGRALGSHQAVLDGEIVAFGEDGRPSFGTLQQRMHVASRDVARRLAKDTPVTYVIFDLLWLDGHSLMGRPYAERRARLAELGLSGESWQTPEHVVGNGPALLRASVEQRLEGIVAKRLDSAYVPGRRPGSWIKIKTMGRQEFVIAGSLPGKGRRSETIGALLLGVHEPGGGLRYVGRVGTGFSDRELARLEAALAPLRREDSPFTGGEAPPRESRFAEPRLVAEVEFAEWTSAGNIRHPSYKGLREDKDPLAVVREDPNAGPPAEHAAAPAAGKRTSRAAKGKRPAKGKPAAEDRPAAKQKPAATKRRPRKAGGVTPKGQDSATIEVEGRELKLSNLGKVLYPEARLREGRADRLLRVGLGGAPAPSGGAGADRHALARRGGVEVLLPEALPGAPAGIGSRPWRSPPEARRSTTRSRATSRPSCGWPTSRRSRCTRPLALAEAIDRPRSMVFDLDPGAPADVIDCARLALQLRALFENLGLESFVKTSGSKGLQLYVPLNVEDVDFAATKTFSKAVAELFEQSDPGRFISRQTRARREGKVLIDWSQNDRNKTTVCVYSLRARPRPTVSTPLEWDEVRAAAEKGDPMRLVFEAKETLARVAKRGDLFAPLLSTRQRLPEFDAGAVTS